jgi:nucleotide-binding universal stress UspA family protein
MKVKPSPKRGRVLVELDPKDDRLMDQARAGIAFEVGPFCLKRVLVPIDFSPCSLKALQYALPFARQFGALLTLLHVVPVGYTLGEFGALDFTLLEVEMRQSAEQQLGDIMRGLGPGLSTESLIRLGRPAQEIVEVAKSLGVDLIVLATHGHTGLKHVFLGSVAESVVRYAPCPVLTVRGQEHEFVTGSSSSPA